MRLFLSLMRRSIMPPGHILRGKRRLVPDVYPCMLNYARERMEMEIKNMNFLRYPYLTPQESHGHAMALGRAAARRKRFQDQTRAEFKKDVTFMERLDHLNVKNVWD